MVLNSIFVKGGLLTFGGDTLTTPLLYSHSTVRDWSPKATRVMFNKSEDCMCDWERFPEWVYGTYKPVLEQDMFVYRYVLLYRFGHNTPQHLV